MPSSKTDPQSRYGGPSLRRFRYRVLLALASLSFASAGAGQSYKLLHSFDGNNGGSHCTLLQAADGKVYGTTQAGGAFGQGSVFVMASDGLTFVTLYSFSGGDGANPSSGVSQGTDGYFYGTTENGGAANGGTVFRVDALGNLMTLYSFPFGSGPKSALVLARDGYFYGATSVTIFRISLAGIFTSLYNFQFGVLFDASLIQARDSNFYGTTSQGGAAGLGTVFRMNHAYEVAILHSFTKDEGFQPTGLIQASDGGFYGTTSAGGTQGLGTVFRMDSAGTVTILHSFSMADGATPSAVLQAQDGDLYGTTWNGGAASNGTVFRLGLGGTFVVVQDFRGTDNGFGQKGALIQGTTGSFYGTTYQGGRSNRGTVFRLDGAGTITTLASLGNAEGAGPQWALLKATDGAFYGTTYSGGACGAGTVFRIDTAGLLTLLHTFSGYLNVSSDDGAYPAGGLIQADDGDIYGTTYGGGAFGVGTIFRMSSSGRMSVIHSFRGITDGNYPRSALVQARDGSFYGTTWRNGGGSGGTVFRLDSAGTLTTIHTFSSTVEGEGPVAALIQANDGNFYGTTPIGGANGAGTVFRMSAAGAVTVIHSFAGLDGAAPHAALIQASDGRLYGTTTGGSNQGTIFRIDLTGSFVNLHNFDSSRDGRDPEAALIQASDGNFYGTASQGGRLGTGTVIQMDPSGNVTVLYTFGGSAGYYSDGQTPTGGLVEGAPGVFYGVDFEGGAGGTGAVFRLSLEPPPPVTGLRMDAPPTATSGAAFTVTVRAVDAAGRTAEGYRGTINFAVLDSRAIQPYRYTFTAVDAGSHTFINAFILVSLGTQSLIVTDSALPISAETNVAVTAAQWIITIAGLDAGGGRVTSIPAGINCPVTCSATFMDSTVLSLSVTSDPGFAFGGWGGSPDCVHSTVTADSNKICVAKFNLTAVLPARSFRPPPRRLTPRAPASP